MSAIRASKPAFIGATIDHYELEDETDLVNLGFVSQKEFSMMSFDEPQQSTDRKWPTKDDPDHFYKFSSFWIERGSKATTIERETYSALEWLGDIGGLYDGLLIIGSTIANPFAILTLKAKLLAWVFVNNDDAPPSDDIDPDQQNKVIKKQGKHQFLLCLNHCRKIRSQKYRRRTLQAMQTVVKDLDLAKFLMHQRLFLLTSLV